MAKMTVTIDADSDKALKHADKIQKAFQQSFERINSDVDGINRKTGRLNQQFSKMGKALKSYAIGAGVFGGIVGSAKLAVSVVRSLNEELERAANLSEKRTEATKTFTQLADTPEEMKELTDYMTGVMKRQGVSYEKASNFVFGAESGGVMEGKRRLEKMIPYTKATGDIALGVGGFQSAFGTEQTDPASLAGKIIKAGSVSRAEASKLGQYAPRAGSRVKTIGGTDEEVLSSISTLSQPMGSVEEASTKVKNLAKNLGQRGIREGGLIKNVRKLKQRGLSQQEMDELIPGAEAQEAYQLMRDNLDKIEKRTETLRGVEERAGTPQGVIAKKMGIYTATSERAAGRAADIWGTRHKERQREQYGTEQKWREAHLKYAKTQISRESENMLQEKFEKLGISLAAKLEGALRQDPGSMMYNASTLVDPVESNRALLDLQQKIDEQKQATQENTQAVREMTTGSTAPTEQTGAEPVNN